MIVFPDVSDSKNLRVFTVLISTLCFLRLTFVSGKFSGSTWNPARVFVEIVKLHLLNLGPLVYSRFLLHTVCTV